MNGGEIGYTEGAREVLKVGKERHAYKYLMYVV